MIDAIKIDTHLNLAFDPIQFERDQCKRDVCMYCGGRTPSVNRNPLGPNEAGNWYHTDGQAQRLCAASAIWARERFEWANAKMPSAYHGEQVNAMPCVAKGRSWIVRICATIEKDVICSDCTEKEACSEPFEHAVSEEEVQCVDYKVIDVRRNDQRS